MGINLEAGKSYKDRNGNTYGPLEIAEPNWQGQTMRFGNFYWSNDGRFDEEESICQTDLIEEVTQPSAQEGAAMKRSAGAAADKQPEPDNARARILSEASSIVNGARAQVYGGPEDNFARIARLWNAHLINRGITDPTNSDTYVTPTDVALLLDLVKTARLAQSPDHWDSWVDKAGYSACGAECAGAVPPEG